MELVVCSAPNHFGMLQKNKEYYFKYLPISKMVIIGAESGRQMFQSDKRVEFVDEETLYPGMTKQRVRELVVAGGGHFTRSNWYFQQFLKMAYALRCREDSYLIWDADTIPVRKINFFQDGKPQFSYCDDYFPDYYNTIEKLFDGRIKRASEKCFIVEHMVIIKSYMQELLQVICDNNKLEGEHFYEKILHAVDRNAMKDSGFSEFETYATYMLTEHSDVYGIRRLKACRYGLVLMGNEMDADKEAWLSKDLDTISFEHFCRPSIFRKKWLNKEVYKNKSFAEVYEWYFNSRYYEMDKHIWAMFDKIKRIKYLIKRAPGKLKEMIEKG